MKKDSHNILIQRHLDKEASAAENQELQSWLAQNPDNQNEFQEMKSIYEQSQNIDFNFDPKTEAGWQNLQNRLNIKSAKVVRMSPMRRVLRIAAVFVGLLAAGFLLNNLLTEANEAVAQEIVVQKGATKKVNLPDGSVIHLNADSKLTVQPEFGQTNRNIALEGEAYFEVAKNKALPFIIETGKVSTKVVGTAFNLTAYPENETVEISVTEGIVEFKDDDEIVKLTANKAAKFDKQAGKIEETPFEKNDLAWQKGELIFNQVSLDEIFKTLERKFDVQINNNSSFGSDKLSTDVKVNESLENALNALKMSTNFEYQNKGKVYTITDK